MSKYLIVDGMNIFFRAIHTISPSAGIDSQIGMGFHIILNSMRKCWREFDVDHVVLCLEGRSWRKDIYPQYKANRAAAKLKLTQHERDTQEILIEAFNDFCEYINTKTNVTVLQNAQSEADDLIAIWIDSHPDDDHVLVSTDSDFLQLLAPNVMMYNGVEQKIIKHDGIFNEKGKPMLDKKTKLPMMPEEVNYFLFEKCIRGDKTDNIFSAYPGVRKKGTKNSVGIIQAFEDRHKKGYKWNNFMLQKWTDHNDEEQVVKDRYALNKQLIDLRAQPDHIKILCAETIADATNQDLVNKSSNVGFDFLKFCGKWDLKKIGEYPDEFAGMLNATY